MRPIAVESTLALTIATSRSVDQRSRRAMTSSTAAVKYSTQAARKRTGRGTIVSCGPDAHSALTSTTGTSTRYRLSRPTTRQAISAGAVGAAGEVAAVAGMREL